MDIRSVNSQTKRQSEAGALQWMSQHSTDAAQQLRDAERRQREKKEKEREEDGDDTKEDENSHDSTIDPSHPQR